MKELVLYVHGKGGSARESDDYQFLFPNCVVVGLEYPVDAPQEAVRIIHAAMEEASAEYDRLILIANSIGAFFCMIAEVDDLIHEAFFISPIVDLEKLICDMLALAKSTEEELESRGVIPTSFGEDLSWEYLCFVRNHSIIWRAPTHILYGSRDNLTTFDSILEFARNHSVQLTVMEDGEHWFHTEEQMRFLFDWSSACVQNHMKSQF